MNNPFNIYCEWLHTELIGQPERAAQADIIIVVNGGCITENLDIYGNPARQSARLSALHLSEWLAANWWRLLWEPDSGSTSPEWEMHHKIGAAGGGYLWPDLAFTSDWNTVLVNSNLTVPSPTEPVYYPRAHNQFISMNSFEQGIESFVNSTVERLSKTAKAYTDLAELWADVASERADPQTIEWRKMEACLGYDPDEAPVHLLENLLHQYDVYGTSTIQELAAASKGQALDHLHSVTKEVQNNGEAIRVPDHTELRNLISAHQGLSDEPPWKRGSQAAKTARTVWNLGDGPIRTGALSEIFGLNLNEQENTANLPLSAGMRMDSIDHGFNASFNQRYITGRRFTLARLVGDYLVTPQHEPLMPATRARTSRQKFQRAFAQEFLCPLDNLLDFLGTASQNDDDVNDAAEHFEVSPLTIRTTLVNKGLMERESLLGDWYA